MTRRLQKKVSLARRRRYARRSKRSKCRGLGKKSCRRREYCIRTRGKRRYCRRKHSRPHN